MESQDPMESIRSAVEHADRNPSKVVSYSWYLVLVSGDKLHLWWYRWWCWQWR